MKAINCKGTLLNLSEPKIMGILNVTPDSFFDGGKHNSIKKALQHVENLIQNGADIIDIGAQSTRPDAKMISVTEENNIIQPYIDAIVKNFPEIILSVDTFYSDVATNAVQNGAAIINDISAGNIDNNMFDSIALLNVPYILMHMQGTPQTMQQNPNYDNVTLEVNQFFSEKLFELKRLGVNDIILDPGYGFGKTIAHNYQLLKNQSLIGFGEYPILTGVSRKSMISKILNIKNKDALNATTALHMLALINGANILRVHDVKETKECIKIFEEYSKY